MNKSIYKLFLFISVIVISLSASGCSEDDGSGYTFRFSVINDPENLDPQLAEDVGSLNVVSNLFVGLLTNDSNGNVVGGVAESYTVSPDGLVYTFNLHDDYYWKSKGDYKEKVTADDFVFTFQRLAQPSTDSPYSENFFMIKNFKKIYSGELNLSELGVYAKDDFTLIIELEKPESTFTVLLTTTPAYPCKESFFYGTEGKYGLETSCIASNGPFYVNSWLYDAYGQDNYVVLKRNQYYNDKNMVYPSGVSYLVSRETEKSISNYTSKATDAIIDDGTTDSLFTSRSAYKKYDDSATGIVFNLSDSIFSVKEVREALSMAINRNEFEDLPDYIQTSGAIVPSAVTVLNKSYRELVSQPVYSMYNISLARYLWTTSLTQSQLDSLLDTTIITSEKFASSKYYSQFTKQWNSVLGFYCPVEILSDSEYNERLKSGNYKIAVVELDGSYNSPASFLDMFSNGMISQFTGFFSDDYEGIMYNAHTSLSLSESVEYYSKAEKYLIDNAVYIPGFYQSKYLVYKKEITDITYNPFGETIFFTNAKKK